jgi:hypothetical protein
MSDSAVGFDRQPDRYASHGRETIDRIRDTLGDRGFHDFCIGTVMRYTDRAGLKGSAQEDLQKADWYLRMSDHITDPVNFPDPRADRAVFVPYVRQKPPL